MSQAELQWASKLRDFKSSHTNFSIFSIF